MILAAGFGTRLFPLTVDRTKPAIPFLGRPLIGYVAEYVAQFGISEIVVNLHHQPQSVIEALGDGSRFGVKIAYSHEQPKILGTSGALDNARHLLEEDVFVIVNGKIITDIDISSAIETHRSSGALATMVLKPNEKREKFTEVFARDGKVTGFGGFPTGTSDDKTDEAAPLMFTGIHILDPRVFDYIPRGVYSDIVPTVYQPAINKGEVIAAHITVGKWFELSTIKRYLDISLAMMTGTSVCKGSGSVIADGAAVSQSVIWDNVVVSGGASLCRTIVADGVKIDEGEILDDVAVVRAESVRSCSDIPEKAPKGYFSGDNYIVPLTEN